MRRRLLLTAIPALFTRPAAARLQCGPFVAPGVQQCQAGIDSTVAAVTADASGGQHLPQWCWAACIEIVFRYYGHPVPQENIVAQTWGGIVNLPARPAQILADLNRGWTDESGRSFNVRADMRSASPITAAQDLAADMPLIVGTLGHAMVLSALVYTRDAAGRGEVNAAIVRDPWPGRGRRNLTAQEWSSVGFLARIRVA